MIGQILNLFTACIHLRLQSLDGSQRYQMFHDIGPTYWSP